MLSKCVTPPVTTPGNHLVDNPLCLRSSQYPCNSAWVHQYKGIALLKQRCKSNIRRQEPAAPGTGKKREEGRTGPSWQAECLPHKWVYAVKSKGRSRSDAEHESPDSSCFRHPIFQNKMQTFWDCWRSNHLGVPSSPCDGLQWSS